MLYAVRPARQRQSFGKPHRHSPGVLNAAALERNVNFSQVLQDALKHQLHLA